jgi:hypothetical protein
MRLAHFGSAKKVLANLNDCRIRRGHVSRGLSAITLLHCQTEPVGVRHLVLESPAEEVF